MEGIKLVFFYLNGINQAFDQILLDFWLELQLQKVKDW